MPFYSIKGTFHVVGYSPDGDTIRFRPTDHSLLSRLSGRPAKLNARGHVSLRLEGIDTLETHYNGLKQPEPFADSATDELLEYLQINDVVWSRERRSVVSAKDGVSGYIFARETDKYGRVIAFACPGETENEDGGNVFFTTETMELSANYHLAANGFSHVTFYWGLFADLRTALAEASKNARDAGLGLHSVDKTEQGFKVESLATLTDETVILPKLFRRLTSYLAETGSVDGFKTALEASAEPVLDLRDNNFTHFDTFVEQDGMNVRLLRSPSELVFDPMPQRIASDFDALVSNASDLLSPSAGEIALTVENVADEERAFAQRVGKLAAQLQR